VAGAAAGGLATLSPANFEELVLASPKLWIVLFTDGLECGPCKTAQTNMMRLSAGLGQAGLEEDVAVRAIAAAAAAATAVPPASRCLVVRARSARRSGRASSSSSSLRTGCR
jgi:hypothetical protein